MRRLLAGYLAALGHAGGGVTLLVGGDALLRRLNARHRGRARPTDILSFSYLEDAGAVPAKRAAKRTRVPAAGRAGALQRAAQWAPLGAPAGELIGELAVSLQRARTQAKANGWSVRTELARLLAHGCAHLAGYDHRTRAQDGRMRRVEEALLDGAGFPGLYPAPTSHAPAQHKPPHKPRKPRTRR